MGLRHFVLSGVSERILIRVGRDVSAPSQMKEEVEFRLNPWGKRKFRSRRFGAVLNLYRGFLA